LKQQGDDADRPLGLLYEERLERAEKRRLQGNELFAQGMHKEALGKYAAALSYMDEDFLMQCEGFYLDKAHEVKMPVHLNMAACQLQLGDFNTAIYNCGEVLSLDPGNSKALYRRACARHQLGQTEGALADLESALKRSPEDSSILKERAAVRATLKRERQAMSQLFKGRLPTGAVGMDTVTTGETALTAKAEEATRVNGARQTAAQSSGHCESHDALPVSPSAGLASSLTRPWRLWQVVVAAVLAWLSALLQFVTGRKPSTREKQS